MKEKILNVLRSEYFTDEEKEERIVEEIDRLEKRRKNSYKAGFFAGVTLTLFLALLKP